MRSRRRKRIKNPLHKPKWYKMVAFFDGEAQQVMEVKGANVLLQGWLPPDDDLGVCAVPTSITHEQGLALEKILEANFKRPLLVLTNNIQLAKLKPITELEAKQIMQNEFMGSVLHVEKESDYGNVKPPEGAAVRAGNCQRHEADLRSTGIITSDGPGSEGQGFERAQAATEIQQGEAQRSGEGREGTGPSF